MSNTHGLIQLEQSRVSVVLTNGELGLVGPGADACEEHDQLMKVVAAELAERLIRSERMREREAIAGEVWREAHAQAHEYE